MEDNKDKGIEEIFVDAKAYIDTRVEHTRLSAIAKGSKIFADLFTNVVVLICFILAFLFGTITLALFLSSLFGSYTQGFGCVAGIYLILAIVVFYTKDRYIEPKLINLFIKKYFDKVEDKDDEI
ncbi:MAG: phage holin family protein [Pedobacter sp.]|jgi:protein-S-isoprenylcysteine O-methyltransferase Ste14|nr:MAG: phage holin family protein [Pedobacter sp.]